MSKVLEQSEFSLASAYHHLGKSLSNLWVDVGKDQDKFRSEVGSTLQTIGLDEAEYYRDAYRMFEGVDFEGVHPPDDKFTALWGLWCEVGFESPWYKCPDDI